jgi:Lecithin:cholesterol acyltransferase
VRSLSSESSHDAVVVIPGIMGSRLRDAATGRLLWGFEDPRWYASALVRADGLRPLHVTDEERAGRYGRVVPDGLLGLPAFLSVLGGLEPYRRLADRLRRTVVDQAAVLEFAYDWRLSVRHNARLLAVAVHEHLRRWRAHPAHEQARLTKPDGRPANVVLVAHSMGGLVARALPLVAGEGVLVDGSVREVPDVTAEIWALVTLGTPFRGSPLAAVLLAGRKRMPLPGEAVRRMAATAPGLHDLLPSYRCVDTGDDVRRLTPADVAALGGDAALAGDAARLHADLLASDVLDPVTRSLVGVAQPTVQSLGLGPDLTSYRHTFSVNADGSLVRHRDGALVRTPGWGDATVPRVSAHRTGSGAIAQRHGSLARTKEAIDFAVGVVSGADLDGARLGDGEIGLDLPDVVSPGETWPMVLTGVDGPAGVTCTVEDAADGRRLAMPRPAWRDGVLAAEVRLPAPGLYRVLVSGGGTAPVVALVLAVDADE